ncbi:MAG: TonB-dependent receptor [Proteobacteria bacterium]|nr:TonB-dependent receptor [Pseudomonadota bacterium]
MIVQSFQPRSAASLPRRRAIVAALVSIIIPTAFAADPPTTLDTVVVTGTRHAQTVDDALAAVTVITRKDIDASPATDVISLLGQQAGVDVARTGGPGQTSSVFLRGANSNQTLVLIDGIRVAAVSNGFFDFANLPLDQIERIEIVRGPRAAYWGSDAIGGVIQIFTRNPHGLSASAHAGSYAQRGGTASFGTPADDDAHMGMTIGYDRLRGFPATDPFNPYGSPADDGYRNRNASLRGSVPLGTQTLGVTALYTDGDVQFAGGPGPEPAQMFSRNTSGGATLSGPVTGNWTQALTVGGADNDITTPVYASRTSSRRTSVDWVNNVNLGTGQTFTFGGNWQRERGASYEFGGTDYARTISNTAGFAGYDGHFGSQQIELAIRHDDNSQFGGATTGTAAWGWQIDKAWKLRASWGQGFRAPSFDELYSPGFFGYYAGNPLLQPERSRSVEAGLEFKPSNEHVFKLSTWRTRVRQMIAFDGPQMQAINVDRASLDGTELSYRFTRGAWSAGSAITVQDPRDTDTGQPLLRRAHRKLAADAHYDFGNGWDLSVDGLAASERTDYGGVRLGGYAVLNLAAGWNFHPGWRVQARLTNLFDKDYELASGYRTPGRGVLLTFSWQQEP